MTKAQEEAIKKLEAAFLACRRAKLAFCGIDSDLYCTADSEEFRDETMASSACEAMLARANFTDTAERIKTYGIYLDSGGA